MDDIDLMQWPNGEAYPLPEWPNDGYVPPSRYGGTTTGQGIAQRATPGDAYIAANPGWSPHMNVATTPGAGGGGAPPGGIFQQTPQGAQERSPMLPQRDMMASSPMLPSREMQRAAAQPQREQASMPMLPMATPTSPQAAYVPAAPGQRTQQGWAMQPMLPMVPMYQDTGGGYQHPLSRAQLAQQRAASGLGIEPASHSLGLILAVVGIGTAAGAVFAGPMGALAGALLGGALANGVRAVRSVSEGTSESDKEAVVSGTYAALTAGAAVYLLYKQRAKKNPDDEGDGEDEATPNAAVDEDDASDETAADE